MTWKSFLKYVTMLTLLSVSTTTLSHDTTHIHPQITLKIAKLIRDKDTESGGEFAYKEIYELLPKPIDNPNLPANSQFLYWGTDFDPQGIADAAEPLSEYFQKENDQLKQYLVGNDPIAMNVITGVVYEDNPFTKVLDHFYHGVEGSPLTVLGYAPGVPSNIRAMDFYNQSIEKMGHYGETSKQEAFFLFGQALHHVEDMTSPAHIHNDAHLTLDILSLNFDAGKDDYEGWWLPQQKKTQGSSLENSNYFVGATTITPVNNPWTKIWGTSTADSLVQTIFNGSTFDASLNYTFSTYEGFSGSYTIPFPADSVPEPVGEMAEMFPCLPPLGKVAPYCLHWSEDSPDAPAHWVINNVGGFQHQFFIGANDAWWPIEVEVNTSIIGQEPAPFYKDKYYIEELASGNDFSNPEGTALAPVKMRSSLGATWVGNMQANTDSIMEKYASTFLSSAVTYGAGFTQSWYDIANTPPYLKAVTATQLPAGGGSLQTAYYALWTWGNNSTVDDVEERMMACQAKDISHIHNKQDLILELEFNEPNKFVFRS